MRALSLAVIGLMFLPIGSTAQQWAADEQAVLNFTTECWEMWADEHVDPYLAQCWHEDITYWWSEHGLPFGARWISRVAPPWFATNDWQAWDIQPAAIKVYGDAAVIQYQLLIVSAAADGTREEYAAGRTDFLVREVGSWKVVAVHEHQANLIR